MRKDVVIAVVAVVVIAAVTFGIAQMRPDLPVSPSTPSSTKTGTAAGGSDTVVMRINGEAVTEAQFNEFVQLAPEESRAFYASPQGRRALSDELIKLKALEQEARRLDVAKDPAVATQIKMSEAQILAAAALKKLVGEATDAELRAEYQKQRTQFETIELAHILVAYEGGMVPPRKAPAPSLEQAMARAQQIAQQVRGGADFAQTASRLSDDTQTSTQGGNLGQAPLGALPPEVLPVVQNMKPGDISPPVRTQLGVHVFKAGKRESKPFEEVREQLGQKMQQEKAVATVTKLEKGAKVDYDPKFFPPAPAQPAAPAGGAPAPAQQQPPQQ
ncbi:MAG TPA: peptidylprolyl isomerase [Thermoanaerobaculia bacterium]